MSKNIGVGGIIKSAKPLPFEAGDGGSLRKCNKSAL